MQGEATIEARHRADMEACPPPLRATLERLHRTQLASRAVFRAASDLLIERRQLRVESEKEPDEARRTTIQERIEALDARLVPADEDRWRAAEAVAAVAQDWEDAKRAYRVAPIPESRRTEALALLDEERQALLQLAREQPRGGEAIRGVCPWSTHSSRPTSSSLGAAETRGRPRG